MKKRKVFQPILLAVILICSILVNTGCSDAILKAMTQTEVPEEDLYIITGIDASVYTYSDKAIIQINQDFDDKFALRTAQDDNWEANSYTALSGYFNKVAWYDYNLFILMDNTYYVFNINKYKIPDQEEIPTDYEGEYYYRNFIPEYELKEYSINEFAELYPEYKTFDWYGH